MASYWTTTTAHAMAKHYADSLTWSTAQIRIALLMATQCAARDDRHTVAGKASRWEIAWLRRALNLRQGQRLPC